MTTILNLALALLGFILSAYALVWCVCWFMSLIGCWPMTERRKSTRTRLQGGRAKHDWSGARWP